MFVGRRDYESDGAAAGWDGAAGGLGGAACNENGAAGVGPRPRNVDGVPATQTAPVQL